MLSEVLERAKSASAAIFAVVFYVVIALMILTAYNQ